MQSEIVKPKVEFGSQLKFTPYAWAKLLYMRDRGNTEVAGYGVTGTEDPLLITDFVLIKQECTAVTFDLDANDSAEYMETMMDKGLMPWQYANILIHTHPGNSPSPSGVDENNFESAFSHPNWAIMFIIAEGGQCYCRLKINVGPGSINELKVAVSWGTPFEGTDTQAWDGEYKDKVHEYVFNVKMTGKEGNKAIIADSFPDIDDPLWYKDSEDRWIGFRHAQQTESSRDSEETIEIDNEIDSNCHWDRNGDVAYWDEEENTWYVFSPIDKKWYVERDDDSKNLEKIDEPDEEWANDVIEWALKFADERVLEMEN